MKLTVLGAPGAGKGTQSRNLAKYYKVAHVSTSDILRQFINGEFNTGNEESGVEPHPIEITPKQVTDMMSKGELIPNELMLSLLVKRLSFDDCKSGYVLDGYPRNADQANAFESAGFCLDAAVFISVSDSVIVERISGRQACVKCGKNYHAVYYPPKKKNICDECGSKLCQRKDDKTATVVNRLKIYHEHTKPILEYYSKRNICIQVNGEDEIDKITQSIIGAIGVE